MCVLQSHSLLSSGWAGRLGLYRKVFSTCRHNSRCKTLLHRVVTHLLVLLYKRRMTSHILYNFFSLTIQCKIYLKNPHNVESHVLRNIKKLYFPSQKPQIHPNFSHQKIEKISWILLNFHAKILEASRTNISKFKAGQKTNEFPFKIVCKNYEIVPVSVVKTKWQASEIPVDLSSDWQVTSSRSAWWTRDKNLWKISTILSYPKLLPTPTLWPNFQLIHPCGEM